MGFTRPLTSVGIFSRNGFNSLDKCNAALGSGAGICKIRIRVKSAANWKTLCQPSSIFMWIQGNFGGSRSDGSFTMAVSKSFLSV